MRTFAALIFFLPALANANCQCDDVEKAIAMERHEDAKYHGCRNCKAVIIDIDACPDFGYECNADWKISSNVLFADTCACAQARCAGTGKLAFDKTIVNKMRCNSSQWIVGERAAKLVVCAKSCDTGTCKSSHPHASADFKPLKVMPADAHNQCARGVCEPDCEMSVLNADGSLLRPLPGVTEVVCTVDGIWRSAGPYVMCNAAREDMPCPSLAQVQATAAPNYLTSGLKTSTENKAKVYKCTAPEKLLAVEGGVVTELPDGAKISCQPNSGIFTTDDGKEIGNKKFTCGEKLVPCPTVPEHTTGGLTGAETEAIPAPTMSNGDTIWQCKAPKDHLFLVPKGMPTAAMDLGTAATIKCTKQSGKIFLVDGGETEIDPAGMDTYTCGQFSCQLCDQTKLVEPTVAACTTQKDFLCKSKPTVTITANCPMLSCPAGESLYLMDTATTGAPVSDAQVKCDATTKMWLFDGTNPIAATAPGFVCALTCDQQCKTPVSDAYSGVDAAAADVTASQMAMQPVCTYSCGPSHSLTLGGQTYSNIVCDMKTKAVTLDALGGTAVSDTNKFSCTACNCDTTDMELTDGSIDLCPMGQLCTNPTASNMCDATCPTDSMAIYKNAAGMLKFSPTIKCASMDWITADKTMAGVTCMFSPGKGAYPLPTTPPGTMACTPITPMGGCPGNTCEFAELVYVQKGDGYYIMCKKGSLVTDQPGTALTSLCSLGVWNDQITMATCDMDNTQVDACKATLMAPVAAAISHSCEFGVCYLSCTDPTKQFEYTLASGVEQNKLLKCYLDEVYAPNLETIMDSTMIKCV